MHANCLICNHSVLQPQNEYVKVHLVKCEKCGFRFSKQIPTEQELINYYNEYGRDDYLSPLTIKRYNEILDTFEKYRQNNRLLDVGCGIGYFLEEAQKRGWEVYGTEYTDRAIEICREKGFQTHKGKLDTANYPLESFDVITSFEVLEHINNPVEEVQNFHKLLRKGGLMYLTTPNFNSLLRYRLKSNYNVITFPEHLCYYTPKTLNRLFTRNQFIKKKVQTTGISLSRLRASQGKTTPPSISKDSTDENVRQKFEKNNGLKSLKRIVNWFLTVFGIGDSLKGSYIKR